MTALERELLILVARSITGRFRPEDVSRIAELLRQLKLEDEKGVL